MRISIAPNAFRGSLSAFQAAVCIDEGLRRSRLAYDGELLPLADGGDGTLDVMLRALGGEKLPVPVSGPRGAPVTAQLGLMADGKTAVVEIAQASGIELLPRDQRDTVLATSYGTGELIRAALERGYRRILIGLGGSATTDGGAGCLEALGARFLDAAGELIPRSGAGLAHLDRIDTSALKPLIDGAEFIVLCDVDNPLTGERGAARVFAPQKGADAAGVQQLDDALGHYAAVIQRMTGRQVEAMPGGGAAGGFGAGLAALLNATLVPGAETLIGLLNYEEVLQTTDLLITGEGKLDAQTASGKAVRAIAALALRHEIPVLALVGTLDIDPDALHALGIDAAWSILPRPCDLPEAAAHAAEWLTHAAQSLGDTLAIRPIL